VQEIKSKSISQVVLPGMFCYMRMSLYLLLSFFSLTLLLFFPGDPQYGHGPEDQEVPLGTNGVKLLIDTLSICSSVTSLDLTGLSLLSFSDC
jgi:hypothetical protein